MAAVEIALNTQLDSLARSYARLSRDVAGRINFACDLDNEEALNVAEREKVHLDQAFFILSFAALENFVTQLACAKQTDDKRRDAMRSAGLEQRWDVAARVAKETLDSEISWTAARPLVLSWYKIRSEIAHGRAPSQFADIPAVLLQADEIADTLAEVTEALNRT